MKGRVVAIQRSRSGRTNKAYILYSECGIRPKSWLKEYVKNAGRENSRNAIYYIEADSAYKAKRIALKRKGL